jgi:hypothetical protein
MKTVGLKIAALFTLLMIGLATAEYMEEDEPVWDEISGYKFNSSQSVSGVGFANSYRYLIANPQVLHSHSSGSGAYDYESVATVQYDIESKDKPEDFYSADRKILLKESVSAANAPTMLNIPGSFKTVPIKSLWRDAVCAGNREGTALWAIFDEAHSLNKEIEVTTSGKESYDYLIDRTRSVSGTLDASMNLNAAFNGTARFGMNMAEIDKEALPYVLQPSRSDSKVMIDEFYRGSYSLTKKMKVSIKATYTENDDDWLPCCFGGYLTEPAYYQKGPNGFGSNLTNIFDCTCSNPISSASCSK